MGLTLSVFCVSGSLSGRADKMLRSAVLIQKLLTSQYSEFEPRLWPIFVSTAESYWTCQWLADGLPATSRRFLPEHRSGLAYIAVIVLNTHLATNQLITISFSLKSFEVVLCITKKDIHTSHQYRSTMVRISAQRLWGCRWFHPHVCVLDVRYQVSSVKV